MFLRIHFFEQLLLLNSLLLFHILYQTWTNMLLDRLNRTRVTFNFELFIITTIYSSLLPILFNCLILWSIMQNWRMILKLFTHITFNFNFQHRVVSFISGNAFENSVMAFSIQINLFLETQVGVRRFILLNFTNLSCDFFIDLVF